MIHRSLKLLFEEFCLIKCSDDGETIQLLQSASCEQAGIGRMKSKSTCSAKLPYTFDLCRDSIRLTSRLAGCVNHPATACASQSEAAMSTMQSGTW